VGESNEDAARRELLEETGVEGVKFCLLDADSVHNEFYGDLLIVTYKMEKVGGQEEAGDDAEEVRYHSLDALPHLPFTSNRKAIEACRRMYRESWAIRDSFILLHTTQEESMLSDQLVGLIEKNAKKIAGLWLAEVRRAEATWSYRKIDPEILLGRVTASLAQFGCWLKGEVSAEEFRTFYQLLAQERKQQGFEIHEILAALSLLKKHVWNFARSHGIWDELIDMYRVLELNRRMAAFFDKAMVYTARGYK